MASASVRYTRRVWDRAGRGSAVDEQSGRWQAGNGDALLSSKVAASQVELRQLRTDLVLRDQDARETAKRLVVAQENYNAAVHGLEQERRAHQAALTALMQAQGELHVIRSSTAWRATSPLRAAGRRAPGLARLAGRAMRLAWWIATLQVATRLRARRARLVPASEPPPPSLPPPAVGLDLSAPLSLAVADEPLVSVIICSYGQERMTAGCLRSLAAAPPAHTTEVILLDDAAPASEQGEALAAWAAAGGVRVVRNEGNLGFLRSCNKAAGLARGAYLYLLNNDTELRPGALDALVDLLEARPEAGMAGSKLLFADGTLQEAGGIVWRDASAWNYGRTLDPALPEFNYVHETDYCSGASLMIRRSLFEALGGFDEAFAPAYYEDTDLAFRMRQAGWKVLYEPRSVVVHHEGASHGTNLSAGGKAHQVINQRLMEKRWASVLTAEHYANGEHVLRARDRARHRIVALVIDHYALEPDRDGGSRALMAVIQGLLDAGWVVKYWPWNQQYHPVYARKLEALGVEVIDQRRAEEFGGWMRREGGELDHVIVGRPDIAAEMVPALLRQTQARLTFFGHDLHFLRMRRQAAVAGDAKLLAQADAMERLERRIWPLFDRVIYLSEEEAAMVRQLAPGVDVRTIVQFCFETPPARRAPPEPGSPHARTALFVAGFAHSPNVDAAQFLVGEIWPLLEAKVGPVPLILAGSSPTDEVRALASERVTVTGFVTELELETLYRSCRVAIVPLRFGAGVKGKVIEALSQGLPLVTTAIGVQGIEDAATFVPVHDDAAGLAESVARLLSDDAAWLAQSRAETAYAAERFSRAAMRNSIVATLTD